MTSAWNAATERGTRGRKRASPSEVSITRAWRRKSKSIVNVRMPWRSGRVDSPREVTCSALPQEWFKRGARASATLPTTCVHMCKVA